MIITVSAGDVTASLAFYDAALGALGWARTVELVDEEEDAAPVEAAAFAPPDGAPSVWVVAGAEATRGLHVRLPARSRLEVERFFDAGVRSGGAAHAAPRRWTPYRRGEFAATVRDPDGNLLEAVAPE